LDLEALIRAVKLEQQVVIGADMNDHVGWCAREYDGTHGGHGYGNRNEERSDIPEMAQ